MKQKSHQCCTCRAFQAYYTRGYCSLLREKNGYCSTHKKVVEKSDGCGKWHVRHITRKDRIRIALLSIPEIYGKIAVIEQILKEEKEAEEILNDKDGSDN
ncbi:MAG: hypothetical protein NC132_03215 [Corallococcus sp.]|nr:hypothetical protein [Corallococcus sp.]MCM1359514.1 hypothetical protein [Corallococcus sp.]MCM1395106.1 hypothetical protein [Corallococcus sp.]